MKTSARKTFRRLTVLSFLAAITLPVILVGCSAPASAPTTPAPQQPVITSPKLGVNPLTISLQFKKGDSTTVKKSVVIANDGQGVMVWAATKTQKWMWMDEANGALQKSYSKTLDISFSASGLDAGTYTDNITVEGTGARNSPQYVQVSLVVTPAETQVDSQSAVMKKAVPDPPWSYSQYKNDNYNFVLKYPEDYITKTTVVRGSTFNAVPPGNKPDADTIMVVVTGTYGVDIESVMQEWAKDAIHVVSGRPNLKLVSSDNATMLLDGVTPAYEFLYESKSSTTGSFQVYAFGFQKGSRYIFFGAVCPLAYGADKLPTWKETARTLELLD